MTEVAVGPSLSGAAALDDRDAMRERLGARRAKREVPHAGDLRGRQLQRVVLVVVPAAQVHRVAATGALGHPHDVDEEVEALVGLGCQQLEVGKMREIERTDSGLHSLVSLTSGSRFGPRGLKPALYVCLLPTISSFPPRARRSGYCQPVVAFVAGVLVGRMLGVALERHHVRPRLLPGIGIVEANLPPIVLAFMGVKRSVTLSFSLAPRNAISGWKFVVSTTSVLPSHRPRASPR